MRETLLPVGGGAMVFAVIQAIVGLNIFVTRGDMEAMRATMAQTYIARAEVDHKFDKIETMIQRINDKVDILIVKRGR